MNNFLSKYFKAIFLALFTFAIAIYFRFSSEHESKSDFSNVTKQISASDLNLNYSDIISYAILGRLAINKTEKLYLETDNNNASFKIIKHKKLLNENNYQLFLDKLKLNDFEVEQLNKELNYYKSNIVAKIKENSQEKLEISTDLYGLRQKILESILNYLNPENESKIEKLSQFVNVVAKIDSSNIKKGVVVFLPDTILFHPEKKEIENDELKTVLHLDDINDLGFKYNQISFVQNNFDFNSFIKIDIDTLNNSFGLKIKVDSDTGEVLNFNLDKHGIKSLIKNSEGKSYSGALEWSEFGLRLDSLFNNSAYDSSVTDSVLKFNVEEFRKKIEKRKKEEKSKTE